MMRFLLVILGLILGLGAVAVTEGRVVHLRKFAPSALPQWTANVTDASGILRGEATGFQVPGLPVTTTLDWSFERLELQGPVWKVGFQAAGVEGSGYLAVPQLTGTAQLTDARGEIALDQLPAIAGGAKVGGILSFRDFDARFDYPDGRIAELHGTARWLGAQIDGFDIGEGALSLVSDQNGGWRAPFEISGDVVVVRGQMQGRFGLSVVQLDVTIEDAGAMPLEWKQTLSRQVTRGENGWVLTRELNLATGWPVF
ncbi:hypothetical protein PEL8287_02448 [Roseovarius litorisediminis]|uniref:General secretion pathway protein N n=1 Tax=Roseovarius litorisediminis TaxID=1312363 RepID=A0A1Y5SSY7_9RHOB|nr:hypothetical protein [Roseovarius litorisediminis]SLN47708.1 hypothetical protein PEL8287_02448 [Roseovarius litorisediminis]